MESASHEYSNITEPYASVEEQEEEGRGTMNRLKNKIRKKTLQPRVTSRTFQQRPIATSTERLTNVLAVNDFVPPDAGVAS